MSLIETQELSIYYERSLKRENGPLIYIGGTGGDLRNKPNQLDSPLKDLFEIISYDQRGLGQTSKPKEAYSMQQYADDAADLKKRGGFEQHRSMHTSEPSAVHCVEVFSASGPD